MLPGFVHSAHPQRVVFGVGSAARIPEEIERMGTTRALVLSTPVQAGIAEAVARGLGDRVAGTFDRATMHVPAELAEEARDRARALGADCFVAVGGGSTIGLGKAIALTSGIPILAVPTTYAGSEMTPIYGLTRGGEKRTGRDPRVLPKTVIYDPLLTTTLPPSLSAASGMNAIAHCVEAMYAHDGNPLVSLMAEEAIRALGSALPAIIAKPDDLSARCNALYGTWFAGSALAYTSMALHHKLCHVLGGAFNLPHAEAHATILPHATRYNREAAPEAMQRIARALNVADAATGLYDLAKGLGLEMRLSGLGISEGQLSRVAELASQAPYPNPAPVIHSGVLALLTSAYAGMRPSP